MIEFTDEEPQSGFISPPVTTAEAGAEAADAGIKLYGFIHPTNYSLFDPMILPTGGTKFSIFGSYADIETELDSIVDICH
jgi:hypothetical protein